MVTTASPLTFSHIVGHELSKRQLQAQLETDRIPHAQLIAGPPGSPVLPMALAFSAYLQCLERSVVGAVCGECAACRHMGNLTHPDVHWLFPTGATPALPNKGLTCNPFLPAWRTFVQQNPYGNLLAWHDHLATPPKQFSIPKHATLTLLKALRLKAFMGPYKIAVIWLPEHLHPNAANALLKLLEEPSSRTLFLLASHAPQQLLTTITSRTQSIYLRPFSDEELALALKDMPGSTAQHTTAVLLAGGNLHVAQQLLTNVTDEGPFRWFSTWMRQCYQQDFAALTAQSEALHAYSALQCKGYFQYALHVLRAALLVQQGAPQLARVDEATLTFVTRMGERLTIDSVQTLIRSFDRACYLVTRNVNIKMLALNLALTTAKCFVRGRRQ